MAGTLTVQNLQGPSTGANANKIIIPSGQTLDVSGGTFTPSAGQVVQELYAENTAGGTFNSTSWTDITSFEINITPKYANSLIVISIWAKTILNNSSVQTGQSNRLLRDNSTVVHSSIWQNYFNRNAVATDIYPPLDFTVIDTPNTTSTVNYKVQGKGYSTHAGPWSFDNNGGGHKHIMIVKEVKQ